MAGTGTGSCRTVPTIGVMVTSAADDAGAAVVDDAVLDAVEFSDGVTDDSVPQATRRIPAMATYPAARG